MIEYIIIFCLAVICCILLIKVIKKQKLDQLRKEYFEIEIAELKQEREDLKKENSGLYEGNLGLYKEKDELENSINKFSQDLEKSKIRRDEIENSIEIIQKQAKNTADQYLQDELKLAEEKVELEKSKIQEILQTNQREATEEYLVALEESSKELQQKVEEIAKANSQLEELQNTISTAIELEQRKQADEMAELKYEIALSDEDLIEINRLREVAPFLRNPRPVYKIIWEGYYRNPTNDLINRVIGLNDTTGIYRLTNTVNNMAYIGQAANISDRWKQHIKCGLGIDTPNSILYQGMKDAGVENFKFEVIETCTREKLNEREKHWINFYKTNEYGYNMTGGNK